MYLLFTLLVYSLPEIRFFHFYSCGYRTVDFHVYQSHIKNFSSYMPVDTFHSTAHSIYFLSTSSLHPHLALKNCAYARSEVCWRCVDTLTGHSLFKKPADLWMNELRDKIIIIESMRQPAEGANKTPESHTSQETECSEVIFRSSTAKACFTDHRRQQCPEKQDNLSFSWLFELHMTH